MQFTQFYNSSKKAFDPDFIISMAVKSMNDADIVDLNISQLIKGERSDGVILGQYSAMTIQIKHQSGGFISPSGNIALIDSFDFVNSIRVTKTNTSAFINGTDEKTKMLKDRYGEQIVGLNSVNEQTILDNGKDKFINSITDRLK